VWQLLQSNGASYASSIERERGRMGENETQISEKPVRQAFGCSFLGPGQSKVGAKGGASLEK